MKQILFYNKFLSARCFQTCYTVFLSHLHSQRWYLILELAFIQKYRGCLGGVFAISNLVTVLFLSIILRSVSTMLVILEHPYPFSIVLVILMFGLKGNSHIWFSVRMHVSAPVFSLILIVWLANIFSAYLEIECLSCLSLLSRWCLMLVLVHLPLGNPLTSGILSDLQLHKVVAAIFYAYLHVMSYFSTISALWSHSRTLISVLVVSSTSITLLASCFR